MWSEVSKSNAISGASELTAEYQKPFSAAELQQLEKALPEIERYIATTQPLNDADKEQVHKRFAYLLDAAKQGARKIDWLNIFVAQIIALVTAGLVDPKIYSAVMSHAATVLNAIFHLGLKLIG